MGQNKFFDHTQICIVYSSAIHGYAILRTVLKIMHGHTGEIKRYC